MTPKEPKRPGACESHLHPRGGGPAKKPYHSRHRAESAARTIRIKGERREKQPTRAYLCPGCRRWFLTSHE